ncbi:MAG: hypothetical protein WC682_01705 [Parcubacteria group bacterium]|jgi:Tfp pilus assembly protein PilX
MKNKNIFFTLKRGSVLVFSLFIMMISLIIGVSMMSTASVGKRSTSSSAKSVNSFQVADSGVEYVFEKVRRYKKITRAGINLDSTDCLDDVFGSDCVLESGYAVVNGSANGGTYKLYFYRGAGGSIQMTSCNNSSSSRVDQITKVKSVGSYSNITRSVEADADLTSI